MAVGEDLVVTQGEGAEDLHEVEVAAVFLEVKYLIYTFNYWSMADDEI